MPVTLPRMPTRRAIGCMTGTSIDGLDAALVEIDGSGLGMRVRFIRGHSLELGEVSIRLRHLADQHPMRAHEITGLMHDFADLHTRAVRELLAGERCDLVSIHGQTVFHKPPLSWQLVQPATIARATGVPVVYDLRQADLAAGGQGAPVTPIADAVFFREMRDVWAVANLGGFCNVTVAPGGGVSPDRIYARDVCVCNQLLDGIARTLLHCDFDADGAAASRGIEHADALIDLEGLLESQRRAQRSLGTGDESAEWVSRWRAQVAPEDLAATACAGIAEEIALATSETSILLLAGGGARNKALARAIASASAARVAPTDEFGLPGQYREAACFAVLGALCQDRVPITLPQVTGCTAPAPISGAWVLP
ncbi:Anhydro-N-acetylmuramic acid kinase [Phycisphaerales bacterium]|nr:Anhydro-N-acetylmuramic acid kinase [Phycisphaerales bacterium]